MLFRELFDQDARGAWLIEPVLEQVERDLELIRELDLRLTYVLDTHVHADHVTGALLASVNRPARASQRSPSFIAARGPVDATAGAS